jgi:hypothetical protein
MKCSAQPEPSPAAVAESDAAINEYVDKAISEMVQEAADKAAGETYADNDEDRSAALSKLAAADRDLSACQERLYTANDALTVMARARHGA